MRRSDSVLFEREHDWLAGLTGGLHPLEFEYRNGADSSSLACVLGETWVAPCLFGVDAVAFSADQFRTVTLYVSVPRSTLLLPAAVKLRYQSGLVGAPALVAKT